MNLNRAIDTFGGRYTSENTALVRCPTHNDDTPSLSLKNGEKELWKCFAGCTQLEVYEALKDNGIFDGYASVVPFKEARKTIEPKVSCSPKSYLDHTGLYPQQAQRSGKFTDEGLAHRYYLWSDMKEFWDCTKAWPDVEYFYKTRRHITGQPKYTWQKNTPKPAPSIFGLQYVKHFAENDFHLNVVEGESDTLTCWLHKLAAIGVSGANNVRTELKEVLSMFKSVFIFKEPDHGGKQFLANILDLGVDKLKDTEISIIELPRSVKDLNGLYQADPERFIEHYWKIVGGTSWKV